MLVTVTVKLISDFFLKNFSFSLSFDMVDESIGRAVMSGHRTVSTHLWFYCLGQLLAQLHSPLVIGVDVPDDALGEDLLLVHGYQRSQGEGGDHVHHDAVGGSVASELLVRCDAGNVSLGFTSRLQLCHHCVSILALQIVTRFFLLFINVL